MKIKFEGVSETLLITLYIRAKDSMTKNPILNDLKAKEIVDSIEYDYSKFDNAKPSYYGVLARGKVMDDEVRKFIDKNPEGIIISVGCGLDTRFERVDNGKINWYNLDLPEVMEKRRLFFRENDRVHNIDKSALDDTWPKDIDISEKNNILITSEGMLQYFEEKDVKKFLEILTNAFDSFEAHFDLSHKLLVNHGKRHDAVKHMKDAEFKFGVEDGSELVKLNPKIKQIGLINFTDEMKKHLPLKMKMFIPFFKKYNNRLGMYVYDRKK